MRDAELPGHLAPGPPFQVAEDDREAILVRQPGQFLVEQGVQVRAGFVRQGLRLGQVGQRPFARPPSGPGRPRREGRPVEDLIPTPYRRHFIPFPDPTLVRSFDEMLANVSSNAAQVVDARGLGRFFGREEEPRPGVERGHIPGSVNVPYSEVVSEDGTVKPNAALEQIFREQGVDLRKPVVTTCGSGITAAIDPYGRVIARAPANQRLALNAPYGRIADTTFYTRHGDWFAYLCAIISAGILLWGIPRRRNGRQ